VRYYFSRRQSKALGDKTLKFSIPVRVRRDIDRTLSAHSELRGQWDEENYTYAQTESRLITFYGDETLWAYDDEDKLSPSNMHNFILRGSPARVFDLIEAWCDLAPEQNTNECERELNSLFEIHNFSWRLVNKSIILIDSAYLHNEVISKTQALLRDNEAAGALEEFTEAVSCLTGGETKDAIINAHKSVESVMKVCLGIKEPKKFGELLHLIIKSRILPEYYKEFLVHFEKLALASVKERNLPARAHGQGAVPTEVPKPLAEFAVHLAGAVNLFLIQRWIESRPKEEEQPASDDDIPF
jgi:predicted transcriptional regulator